MAALLTVYLGLSGGGYDLVVRSEIGLVIWWFLLLGTLIGVLPLARLPRVGWIVAAALAGFLLWSWIGLVWSSSHELTLAEVARLSTYLGVFLLGLCILTVETAPALINGLGCGIATVSAIAVLSKLSPSLFPADTAKTFYQTARLSYPFDYADGVGEYAALGLPLVLYMATSARTIIGRGLASASILPVLLCLAMTVSRGGILAALVGTVAFLTLVPNRIPRLPMLGIAAAGTAVLMLALLHRPALRDSVQAAPPSQRHSMLALVLVVMVVSAALQCAVAAVLRRARRPQWLVVSPRTARAISATIVVVVAVGVGVLVAAGTTSHLWHDFKIWEPTKHSNQYFRLLSLAGSHRYQYWQVAMHAFSSSPLHGIGAGTFRYYWERHTTHPEFILNAHSLWIETLAETGIIGELLLVSFFALLAIGGAARALRAPGELRTLTATATAGVFAFCAAASFDWIWQLAVVPMTMLLLASVTFVAATNPRGSHRPQTRAGALARTRAAGSRVFGATAALLALVLIAIPLASTIALNASERAARAGRLAQALAAANTAQAIEPGAASPYLQRALIFEQANEIGIANRQIAAAIAREPGNYMLWVEASRLATEADRPRQALRDFLRAKSLYPTSTYFIG